MGSAKCFCGIYGVFNDKEAPILTYYGLHALQHRGQEASGIVSLNESSGKPVFNIVKNHGLVTEVFSHSDIFSKELKGFAAIGHNRYSTTGSSASEKNIQPLVVNYRDGNLAIAHNGNLTNAQELRDELINEGAIFQTTSDTEVILHLIARSRLTDQIEQIKEALLKIRGAYCLLILTNDKLIAARDPNGFRPLCLGRIGDSYFVSSETCAFDINKVNYIRDIDPGEIVVIDKEAVANKKPQSIIFQKDVAVKHCIFEFIYFSRPDSKIFGVSVDKMRRKLGKVLAQKHPVVSKDGEKVIVISVPDSSNTTAIGFQNQLIKDNIPSKLEIGLIRSHYIGRTFIAPNQQAREIGVRIKFNIVKGVLEGKTVVVIDDSIVRGTTSKQLIKLIREANPKEIHMRISSPPIVSPCFYGMDFPSKEELVANKFNKDISKIKDYLEVDSLEYLTTEEMLSAMVDNKPDDFCTACFSGIYPLAVNKEIVKEQYEN